MSEPRVFISHAGSDLEAALKVKLALGDRGIDAIVLGEQSSFHTDLAIEVKSGIRESYAVLALVSSEYLKSSAVDEDLDFAETMPEKKILPVSVDGTQIPERMRHLFNFMEGEFDVRRIAEILYEIRPQTWSTQDEPHVAFPPDITPDETTALLTALAKYWRNCGGIGLAVEFDMEEARVGVPAHV